METETLVTECKQNKGEWSEFYAFIKLLSQGFVDMETSTDSLRKRAKVISVHKNGIDFFIDDLEVRSSVGGTQSIEELRSISKKILRSIINGSSSFAVPVAYELSQTIRISAMKQSSSSIADLFAKIRHEDRDADYDLSIKSWLGAHPSFFNASKNSTRIRYKICGLIPKSELMTLCERKATSNVKAIYSNGGFLKLFNYANKNLVDGLEFVNSDGPSFFADLVISGFLAGRDGLEKSVKKELPSIASAFTIYKEKYQLFSTIKNQFMFEARIKNLLYHMLMHRLQSGAPETINVKTPDNYLAVMSNGNLLCIVGREKLQEKLFNLCKMDSPASSTRKHDYGFVYESQGKWYIDLQPGIRLTPPR